MRLCPWSSALASSIPVLGLERVCPRKGCPWPRIFFVSLALALASSLVSSTPPLEATSLTAANLVNHFPVNMHISDQYCLRAVLYCVYRCCLANIETTVGLFYKTHISEIRKILLNCFISQFNFIRHSYLHVLISVLSKDKCNYTILCKNCSILSKQYRITNTEQH